MHQDNKKKELFLKISKGEEKANFFFMDAFKVFGFIVLESNQFKWNQVIMLLFF